MGAINLKSSVNENLIHNPLNDIWQRGTSNTNLGSGVYTADRFRTSTNSATMKMTIKMRIQQPVS